jgi:hypothetical protein
VEDSPVPAALVGRWLVRREAGLLPGLGLSKVIHSNGRGVTCIARVPLLPFVIHMRPLGASAELRYRLFPLRDELVPDVDGWMGRGFFAGWEFCRFRLTRPAELERPAMSAPHF